MFWYLAKGETWEAYLIQEEGGGRGEGGGGADVGQVKYIWK